MANAEQHAVRIALAASARPPAERGEFLERACGGDADLLRAVGVLLTEDDDEGALGDFLEPPITGVAAHLADLFLQEGDGPQAAE